MPIIHRVVAFTTIALLAACASAAGPPTSPADPLPRPPMQDQPWTPTKTYLPATLLSATDLLFKQGMADPRGCEYREIQIELIHDIRFDAGAPTVHGWLIPASGGGTTRFAVGWNGVEYPVRSIGRPADLDADIAAAIAQDEKATGGYGIEQVWGLSATQMDSVKVCLLLRLGKGELAEQFWHQRSRQSAAQPAAASGESDPYLELAQSWAQNLYDRAVTAHQYGDDAGSLHAAAILAAAQPQIEAASAARHYPRPAADDPNTGGRIPNPPYLPFLANVPSLLADEQRRVAEGDVHRVLDHQAEYADKAKRIAGLIRDLENDSAAQMSNPGYPDMTDDPIAVALVKEGTDAVEPILQCMAHDQRLTRAVSFNQWAAKARHLIPVSEAAYDVLCRILEAYQFGPHTRPGWNVDDRAAIAAEVGDFWKRYHGLSRQERWYRTLADDEAGPEMWIEAIQNMMRPVDDTPFTGWPILYPLTSAPTPPLLGDSLRDKKNPSVAELIARRVPEFTDLAPDGSDEDARAEDATKAALALGKWDPAASIPVIQAELRTVAPISNKQTGPDWQEDALVKDQSCLYAARQLLGDPSACRAYAEWIRNLRVPSMPNEDLIFLPLWQEPDDPDIQATAQWLFNHPASPWCALYKMPAPGNAAMALVHSPLVGVPAFRNVVLRNLQDHAPTKETADFGMTVPATDPLAPKPGEKRRLRVCDAYASEIASIGGAPDFQAYWPQANRDAAIKLQIEFLQTWGSQLASNRMPQAMFDPDEPHACLVFPQRDRPATDAEAKSHTAIFSLAAAAKVRVAPIDPFPCQATWKTLKQFVNYGLTIDSTGKDIWVESYDQGGWIWQAEEKWEGGKWKRYYGFVGNHIVAMVPAEEIELVKPATQP